MLSPESKYLILAIALIAGATLLLWKQRLPRIAVARLQRRRRWLLTPHRFSRIRTWSFVSIAVHFALFLLTVWTLQRDLSADGPKFMAEVVGALELKQPATFERVPDLLIIGLVSVVVLYFARFYLSLILFDESVRYRNLFLRPLGRVCRFLELWFRSVGFLALLWELHGGAANFLMNSPPEKWLLNMTRAVFSFGEQTSATQPFVSLSVFMFLFFLWWIIWDLILILGNPIRETRKVILRRYMGAHVTGVIVWGFLGILASHASSNAVAVFTLLMIVCFVVLLVTLWYFVDMFRGTESLDGRSQAGEFVRVLVENLRYLCAY